MERLSLHVVFIFALIIVFTPGPVQRLQYASQDKSSPQTHVMYSLQKGGEVTLKEIEETKRRNYKLILTGVQKPVLDGPKNLELVRKDSWSFCDQQRPKYRLASRLQTELQWAIIRKAKSKWLEIHLNEKTSNKECIVS